MHCLQRHQRQRQRGFTLVEMVMVIVIMGVIGGMVAVFMKKPIDAYFDTARRAALADEADTATRRMARDLRKALPNSIRNANNQCIEFIPTKTGGRYRAEGTGALNFSAAATSFNMLGSNSVLPADQTIAANDVIVVDNLGIAGADAYSQNNTAVVSALGVEAGSPIETPITIASTLFPLASPGSRFHVVPGAEKVVAYVCSGGNLRRTVSSTFTPASCLATGPILATNVASCNFVYNGSDLQRNGLVQLGMTFTQANESVSLYHEVHVDNTP